MEGIENTSPNQTVPSGPDISNTLNENNDSSPPSGASASIHAPENRDKGKAKETVTINSSNDTESSTQAANKPKTTKDYQWTVITSKKTHAVLFPYENAPGKTSDEKKKAVYELIGSANSYIGIDITTMKTTKYVKTTFSDKSHADSACNAHFPNLENINFVTVEQILAKSSNATHFQVKIHDIPLDLDKPLFLEYLNAIDKVIHIKWIVRGLYYQCIVTFENKTARLAFQYWSLNYGKNSFRYYATDLSKEDFEHRRKYSLKLTGLPMGTTAYDIEEGIKAVRGLTCFIPRRQDSRSYQRERFAFVQFYDEATMTAALNQPLSYKGKPLYWVPTNTKTCHVCGSHMHMKRSCKEAKRAIEQVERTNRFSRLYSNFKVAPPPKPKNFFLVMDEDNMNNWDEPRDQSLPRSRSRSKNTRNKNNFNLGVNPSNKTTITSNNSYANVLKNKNKNYNVNSGPPPIPPRPNLKNNKNRPFPQKKDVTILPTSISVNEFNDTVKRINALEELFTQLTTQVGLLAQRMTEVETKIRTDVPQYIPSLNMERDIFNENNKRVRSSSYIPSHKELNTWNTDFGTTSPSFSSSSMDTTPITGPPLAGSPSSSSPTVSSEEQLNDRLSSLEQVASTAMNALNMFTSRFSYDQRTGRQLPHTESDQQQFHPTSPNEQ
jgi:hypothetical protein